MRTGPESYARKGDAERALVLIEAQISAGEWTDPGRSGAALLFASLEMAPSTLSKRARRRSCRV